MIRNVAQPAAYDESVLYAFRALAEGKANEGQQKRALEWLVHNACHIGLVSFAESDRETSFLEGQRSIGLQVARLLQPEGLQLLEGRRTRRSKRQEAK